MTKILEVGQKAPNFSIPDQNGKTIELENLLGKWTVVYFYPRDDPATNKPCHQLLLREL